MKRKPFEVLTKDDFDMLVTICLKLMAHTNREDRFLTALKFDVGEFLDLPTPQREAGWGDLCLAVGFADGAHALSKFTEAQSWEQ